MGLEALAAGLVITVKDRTSRGLATIGKGFTTLKKKGGQLRGAMSSMGTAFTGLAVAGAALGAGIAFASKKAIDFEKQLSAVRAVTGQTRAEMAPLTAEIKRLGATTVFSATEAAAGAENLSRAGFSATETISALGAALDAAAADGIDLATSARLIANNVRGFGLEALEAGRVADVLANTSAKSNTNMTELGEGLKFVAPIARSLGVEIEDASAALGVLADAGLRGGIGGTSLKNALIKMAKPTAAGAKLMKKYAFGIVTAEDGSVKLGATIDNLAVALEKIPNKLDKVAFSQEVFGIRGAAAMDNMVAAGEKAEGGFKAVLAKIQKDTEGAAKRMKEIRLDNVAGSFTLLGSAIEGLAIEVFTDNLGTMKTSVRFLADALGVVVQTLQQARDGFIMDTEEMAKFRAKFGPLTDDLIMFSLGIREGLDMMQAGVAIAMDFAKSLKVTFGEDSDTMKGLGKFTAIAIPIIAILGILGGAALIIAAPFIAFGSAIFTALQVVGVALIPIIAGFALFFGAVQKGRKDGESFGDSMLRTFGGVKQFAQDFFMSVKAGYEAFLKPAFADLMQAGEGLLLAFDPIFDEIGKLFGEMGGEGLSMGRVITQVIGGIATTMAWLVRHVLTPTIKFFVDSFTGGFLSGIVDIVGGFVDLVTGADTIGNSLLRIFIGIGKTILNVLLIPLKTAISAIVAAANLVGLGDNEIVKGAQSALEVLQFKEGPFASGRRGGGSQNAKVVHGFGKGKANADVLTLPKAASAKAGKPGDVVVNNKPPDSKTTINNNLKVDGREMNAATGQVELENLERLGGVQTPFFNKAIRSAGNTVAPSGR